MSRKAPITALIDGDVFIFRAALLAEVPIEWTDDIWTLHANLNEAMSLFDGMCRTAVKETGATGFLIALSDVNNFRRMLLSSYKHNRRDKRAPMLRGKLRELIEAKYNCTAIPLLEGDDVLGIWATGSEVEGERIIVSIDKDMKTLPCTYYNIDDKRTLTFTETEADYNHLVQTLTGDTADGYPGCPGAGPVKAEKLLSPFLTKAGFDEVGAWAAVVAEYAKKGFGPEYALTQARVARICRASDYDFANKRPIPWKPKSKLLGTRTDSIVADELATSKPNRKDAEKVEQ